MTRGRLAAGAALAVLASGALAGQAGAATKTVFAGPNVKPSRLPEGLVLNDFYVRNVKIRVGDSVSWRMRGFHNVYLPRKGGRPAPLLVADPGTPVTGVTDAAGQPFWFNGRPRTTIDPRSAFASGGKAYNGSAAAGSGIPEGDGEPPPFKVRFTRKGSFTYFCTVHPGMKGKVQVVARRARIPSAAQDRRVAARQLARQLKAARKLDARRPPAGTILGGSDRAPAAWLKFYPADFSAQAGATIRFAVPGAQEPHTLSIGPADYLRQIVENQIAPVPNPSGPPTLVFDPRVIYPSDPPPFAPFDGAAHGNGFFNTGVLAKGLPGGTTVRFAISKAGTYSYICLIHPEMQGRITVTQ